MVAKAIDHGINIFDNAWEFHRGLSEEKLGIALKGKRDNVIVMSSVCTHGPNEDLAMRMLEGVAYPSADPSSRCLADSRGYLSE